VVGRARRARAGALRRQWLHCSLALCVAACALATPVRAQGTNPGSPAAAPAAPVILVVGDSLSAEYGIARGQGWVALLEQRLQREGLRGTVVNASVSGDTTSGGKARLPGLLTRHRPAIVVIELGGNDALRGLPVLLLGMQMPPNYGPDMTRQFAELYPAVAKAQGAALVPFFLKNVGDDPDPARWFQADRIHPSEAAQPRLLANVWPELKKQLK